MFIKNNNLKIIYNIQYCSQFNQIEYIFSLLIKKLLIEEINDKEDIIKIILNFKKEINSIPVKNIFNKCMIDIEIYKYLIIYIKRELIKINKQIKKSIILNNIILTWTDYKHEVNIINIITKILY